jgi:hypothetical protein
MANSKKADDLASVAAALQAVQKQLDTLGLTSLTPEERTHSNGRLRGGEEKALTAILDSMDLRPGLFASLADRDGGTDDAKLETQPSRDALARVAALRPLAALADAISTLISDELLHQGAQVKEVTGPAYGIVKVNVGLDSKLAKKAEPATKFYGSNGKKSQQTKAKKKAKTP